MNAFRILLLLLTAGHGHIVSGQINRIDSLSQTLYQGHTLNGNVLVADHGKIIYEKCFGFADLETRSPNQQSTRFQLASIGKIFTATAILQLKEKKLLQLDDPVTHYLPDFPFAEVTLRHLLSHTSGLPDLQIFDPLVKENPNKIMDNSVVIEALTRYGKLDFKPGEKWRYSNPGYCVLALIVEKVSRLTFNDYLTKNIWKPASMFATYPYSAAQPHPDPLRAVGYRAPIYSYQLQKVDTMSRYKALLINFGGLQGLGFVASTTGDLLNFDKALYNGILLKPATMKEAFQPQKTTSGEPVIVEPGRLTFGLGWFIATDTTHGHVVSHSGFIPGGTTVFLRNITKKQTVILLDNAESEGIHQAGAQMISLLNGGRATIQKKSLTKIYANDLMTSGTDYAACHFHELKPDTSHYRFSPGEMDFCARELYAAGYQSQALETSKLLTFVEPEAWQTYNSYAELLVACGKQKEARMMFRKSLSLNPDNPIAQQALNRLSSD